MTQNELIILYEQSFIDVFKSIRVDDILDEDYPVQQAWKLGRDLYNKRGRGE